MSNTFSSPILSIETALGAASVCVWQAGVVRGEWLAESAFDNAKQLMHGVETALSNAQMSYANIGALACSVGPGSFTGLRVGLAAARALALAMQCPLVPVTTLEALLAKHAESLTQKTGWTMINAMRGQVYAQAFAQEQDTYALTGAPMLLDYADACAHVSGSVMLGNAAECFADFSADRSHWHHTMPLAADVAQLAAHKLTQSPTQPEAMPVYVRAPDAKMKVAQN